MGPRGLALAAAVSLLTQQPKPVFKSGVEVVAVDVHVVDKNGRPILDLKPEDFEVQISGKSRRVVSAELISYADAPPSTNPVSAAPAQPATTVAPRPRRMFILAVDEHSLHISNALAAVNAAERFIDKLEPDDLVGLVAYPTAVATHDLTTDHASVRRAVRKITGLFDEPSGKFGLSPSEVVDIASGDRDALLKVVRRACPVPSPGCAQRDIQGEAISLVGFMEMQVTRSVRSLQGLVRGLGAIPGRKILVLVSGGLVSTTRGTGRANASAEIRELGRETARANVAVFALHLDWSFLQALSSRAGLRTTYFSDSNMAANGLEMVAGTAGGTVIRVHGTSPDVAFDRVLRETSAYYLVGVEGSAGDRDGRSHTIRVRVKRRGAEVRSRTELVIPKQ